MIRVCVRVQSGIVRAGLHAMLQPEFEIVENQNTNANVDVLVCDIILLPTDVAAKNFAATLLLSDDPNLLQEFLQQQFQSHKAWGVVPTNTNQTEFRAAVQAVAHGFVVLPQNLLNTFGETENITELPDDLTEALTQRELEVLALLVEGDGNKRIATSLGISQSTVKFHLAQIYAKLEVTSRTGAVQAALRRGLITL